MLISEFVFPGWVFCSLVPVFSLVFGLLWPGFLVANQTSVPVAVSVPVGGWTFDDSLAFDLCLSWELGDGDEERNGELGTLSEWRRSACGLPICASYGRCGLWSSRESLSEFTYLFFWLAWPTFFLLTGTAQVGAKGIATGRYGLGWRQWNGGFVKEYRRCGSSSDRCILFFWAVCHLFWLVCQ